MTHVDDSSQDFVGLEHLDPKTAGVVKQARIEARDVIDDLEPRHILGWNDLIRKLEDRLRRAKDNQKIFDGGGGSSFKYSRLANSRLFLFLKVI